MQANWGNSGLGTLGVGNGNPGNSAEHLGGTVNSWIVSSFSLTPTATESIVLTADIFDDGTSSNERMPVDVWPLRDSWGSPARLLKRLAGFAYQN
ncbi:MAG: hypothetical protein NXI32_00020 [bacterium]|nr:hypothetical protein [bacterium]